MEATLRGRRETQAPRSSFLGPIATGSLPPGTFPCHICPRTFNSAPGRKSHITRKHPKLTTSASSTFATSQDVSAHDLTETRTLSENTSRESLFENFGKLRSSMRILRRIPKGARGTVATALADTIEACLSGGSVREWERLLLFSALCLQVPEKLDNHRPSLTTSVKENVRTFLAGKTLSPSFATTQPRSSVISSTARSRQVQAKLSDGDVRGAVRLLGSEDSFAPDNSTTLETLIAQHPGSVSDDVAAPSVDGSLHVPLQVSESEVAGVISSFPTGSAGGIDLLRPQHLKDLTSHSAGLAGVRLLSALTKLCNFMLSGSVPQEICRILYGASLCALSKKSGGIRPIAIGCTFRRLVAKLCSTRLASRLGETFQPIQLGFGTKRGVEIATHLARRYVTYPHQQPKVFLKIDFRNAFNSLHRGHILRSVATQLPELYPFVHQCYGTSSSLFFGNHIISSARGVQQGDPLGPALFCLVLQPVASESLSELNVWYLDDGSLGGAPDEVLQDFSTLVDRSNELSLEINDSKCELYCMGASDEVAQDILSQFQHLAPNLKLLPLSTCSLLGAPMFQSAAAEALDAKTETLRLISSRLPDLPAQSAFFILKNSLAIPRLTHLLRCSPTWECPDSLSAFDSTLREALSQVTNVSLSEAAWIQSSWPVALGGLGIRHAQTLALPAFLSSVYGSKDKVDCILPPALLDTLDLTLSNSLEAWKTLSPTPPPAPDLQHSQREWERPLLELSIRTAMEQATSSLHKARLHGVSSIESGAFLNALPSSPLGTLLEDDEFRISVALRLGANICQPHTCVCGAQVTESGLHGLCCRKSAGRFSRHASVNAVIQRALSSAGIPSSLEPQHLALDTNIRPDGITQIPWSGGKSLTWDYTCTDSLAPSHVEIASGAPLAAASIAEQNKRNKYAYLAQTHIFVPVVTECLGSVGREGLDFLRSIGRRITAATGEKRATSFLLQRISIAVQRGNARSIKDTIPTGVSLDDCIFLL